MGKYLLPTLYSSYLLAWALRPSEQNVVTIPHEPPKIDPDAKTEIEASNGIETVDVKTSAPTPPPRLPALWAFLFDLPSLPPPARAASFLLNTLLLILSVDMAFVPLTRSYNGVVFARLGAVDSSSVKIVVRYPGVEDNQVKILWRQITPGLDAPPVWKDGPLLTLSEENDWVAVGKLSRLWPSTSYEYRLSTSNATFLPYPAEPLTFRTFPDHRLTTGAHFRFLASSCVLPNFPYQPFRPNRIKGFDFVANYVWPHGTGPVSTPLPASAPPPSPEVEAEVLTSEAPVQDTELVASLVLPETPTAQSTATPEVAPLFTVTPAPQPPPAPAPTVETEFMMLLGDFIYADVPVYHGNSIEKYRRHYRRNYASHSFRRIYEKLPIYHIYDDHEFINDYAGDSNDTAPFLNASSAYSTYNHASNYDSPDKESYFYDFRYADVAFFVMDTRRYRSAPGSESKTMLGEKQLTALHSWLAKVNSTATFKFIVSSVPFSTLWGRDAQIDSWAAYRQERDHLLELMSTVHNVIVISGDRHQFAAVELNGGRVLEISTSPLSMFYVPFMSPLSKASIQNIEKKVTKVVVNEEGIEELVEEIEYQPQEKVIKYIPRGNYKFSSFEVDTRDRQNPRLKIEAVINGKVAWHLKIIGQPVPLGSSTALGLGNFKNLKGMLDKIGLLPSKWF